MSRRPSTGAIAAEHAGWLRQRYGIDGATVDTIAEEAGCDRTSVYDALHTLGIDLRGHVDRRSWSDVLTRDYLADRLAAGWSISDIATANGCTRARVREWMATHQLLDTDPAEDRLLRRWYLAEGMSIPQVAARLGVHQRTARTRLLAAGIQLRPGGRRPAAGEA